ncbi:membrane glycoprotein UL11 [Human betaherpesvirus 5]|uniref:Membrane glycoprotein UL11 n=1 Tax=Human cytomegalovirus TaxID=10359 RepID=A0A0G2TMZ7_HCMV|nr:membrane glycoprotein UL11 [Human betaherpesvirus 5]AKI14426.1 membrane glycoprotein UL11 [Human betaherpesvirus 5]AMO64532.1 membrane glycoprotein UL11 [Human betaherpesvirus 5]
MLLRYITFHREKVLYLTAACIFGIYISFHDACTLVPAKVGTNVTLNAVDVQNNDYVYWSFGGGGGNRLMCRYTPKLEEIHKNTNRSFSCLKNHSLVLINVTEEYTDYYRTMTAFVHQSHNQHGHGNRWTLDTCYYVYVTQNGTLPTTTTKKPTTTTRTTTTTTTKKTTTTRTTTTSTTAKKTTTSTTHHRHSNPKESTTPNSHVEHHVGLGATAAETPLQPSPQYQHVATHALWVLAVVIVIIIIIIFYFRIPQKLWLLWQHDKHGIVLIPQTDL